jgi:hypothetical protein
MKILMKQNMRIWRGGSLGSGPVGGGHGQAAREAGVNGHAREHPVALQEAARCAAGGGNGGWAAACVGASGVGPGSGGRHRQRQVVLGGWCG